MAIFHRSRHHFSATYLFSLRPRVNPFFRRWNKLKSEIESNKLILWSARNRRLSMLWYKLTLFVQLLCYHVDKFPVFIITGPPSATFPCKTNLEMISLVTRFPSPGFLCGCVLNQLQTWSVFLPKELFQNLSKMVASVNLPVWKSLRVFRTTWLHFLIMGETVVWTAPVRTGNPMNLSAIPYSIISVKL